MFPMATALHGGETAREEQDYEAELVLKTQRDWRLTWLLGLAGLSVAASWLLGAAGASMAWPLLLLALLTAVWRSSLAALVHSAVRFEALRTARRRALSADETAEWLNFLVNRWWVFSSPSLHAVIRDGLEPLLNEVKPSFVERVELRHFTLGDQTPRVTAVRAFEVCSGGARRPLTVTALTRPPPGLALHLKHQVAIEADLSLDCDDFRMLLHAKFTKGVGLELALEKLNVSGRASCTVTLSMDAPFPHVTNLSLAFLDRPQVWFSIRILKAVQMMEVPLLKTWLHSVVMEALVTSLVDPGKLDISLASAEGPSAGRGLGDTVARGVLTVTLSLPPPGLGGPVTLAGDTTRDRAHSGAGMDGDARWLVLQLGSQRQVTPPLGGPRWQHTGSFLLASPRHDVLLLKLKTKRFVSAITLAQFELPLASYSLDTNKVVETLLHKKLSKAGVSGAVPGVALRLEYSPLPDLSFEPPSPDDPAPPLAETPGEAHQPLGVAGVMVVCIHSAEGLAPASEPADCNPYCMLFHSRKKVKTTHYLRATGSPSWETRAQFLVSDFTAAALSLVVCSWGRDKAAASGADTDLIGIATLGLTQEERMVVRRRLPLSTAQGSSAGSVLVSAAFCAVPAVAQALQHPRGTVGVAGSSPAGSDHEDDSSVSSGRSKRSASNWMQQAKQLLGCRENESGGVDISSLMANGRGLIEVSLIRARELVAKDLNGFSDPYCELRLGGEVKFKSAVRKKTLNPSWGESALVGMPRPGEELELVVWDHDVFGMKDFLGDVRLTGDEIRKLSALDEPQWRRLHGVKSGQIEIRVKVIADTAEQALQQSGAPQQSEGSMRRGEAERARLRLPLQDGPGGPAGGHAEARQGPPPPPVRTVTAPRTNGHAALNGCERRGSSCSSGGASSVGPSNGTANGHHEELRAEPRGPLLQVRRPQGTTGSATPSPTEPGPRKGAHEYSSFRQVKNKVKRGLSLRRFRSEVHVAGEGVSSLQVAAREEADGEPLEHTVSQPDIPASLLQLPAPLLMHPGSRPVRSGTAPYERPERFSGVGGSVVQAQGLHVAHIAQLYCRVRLQGASSPERRGGGGKTVAKSRLIPAVPNPRFDLPFELGGGEVAREAALLFEVRATGKELVASRRVPLHELLKDATSASPAVRTWLALSTGASLEVEVGLNREPARKGTRSLFRSWSLHRIGKI